MKWYAKCTLTCLINVIYLKYVKYVSSLCSHFHEYVMHPRTPSAGFKKLTCTDKRERLVSMFQSSTSRNLEPFHLPVVCQTDPHSIDCSPKVSLLRHRIRAPFPNLTSSPTLLSASDTHHCILCYSALDSTPVRTRPGLPSATKTHLNLPSCIYISRRTLRVTYKTRPLLYIKLKLLKPPSPL